SASKSCAQRENIGIIPRSGTSRRGKAFAHGCRHPWTLVCCETNAHPGSAENQSLLKPSFRDVRSDKKTYAVIHGCFLGDRGNVEYRPASASELFSDVFLSGEPGKICSDDDLEITSVLHSTL